VLGNPREGPVLDKLDLGEEASKVKKRKETLGGKVGKEGRGIFSARKNSQIAGQLWRFQMR